MIELSAPTGIDLWLAESGLNQDMLPVFLGIMLAAAIAWFFLSRRLYHLLKHNHPEVYGKIGQPKLFMMKSLTSNYRVVFFLLKRTYEETGDVDIIRLCQGLRNIFFVYVVCLAGCLVLLLDKLF